MTITRGTNFHLCLQLRQNYKALVKSLVYGLIDHGVLHLILLGVGSLIKIAVTYGIYLCVFLLLFNLVGAPAPPLSFILLLSKMNWPFGEVVKILTVFHLDHNNSNKCSCEFSNHSFSGWGGGVNPKDSKRKTTNPNHHGQFN